MQKKTSIILCTFNEVDFIRNTIELLNNNLNNLEIVVIDDNSTDGTIEVLKNLHQTKNIKYFVRKKNKGLASAFSRGLIEVSGDYIGWIDANMGELSSKFNLMQKQLNNDESDLIILSRYVKGGGDERDFLRVICSRFLNLFCGFILGSKIKDYSSSIFLMKRSILNETSLLGYGHCEFFIEFLYQVKKKGFNIKEIPYIQTQDTNSKNSKSAPNIFRYFFLGFFYIIRILLIRFRRN